ncbi:DUF2267 domain-containing protein [Ginsengibacter hankyongi]|uniref:DUF2267 domain-containing protein n=1 Tax=Ginsengibacter hankyongi TaxID=2607284 RepID=A0A5J5ICZ9_9BACT|nr:DUF2267 domain-containing protein [Ginsengibacter hankyongi]KAA9035936.1 DUF2267 domain-containing protein [Ginsengibacter hankyongi]
MSLDFERYAAKGNEFVNLVAEDINVPRDKAGRIIRAVLHALRNKLTMEESFQLMAQLPMALKGVYVEGWAIHQEFHRISHVNEFFDEIRKEDGGQAGYDFGNNEKTKVAVAAIFKALNFYISEGEINDVMGAMPKELRAFIRKSIAGNETVL